MFRMWGKAMKDNHILADLVVEIDHMKMTRTQMIFHSLEEICMEFDLSVPIWLDANISEMKRHKKTRFYPGNFVDDIEFDYLEIEIIEE